MKKLVKAFVLTAAVAATSLVPLASAQADHRYRHYGRHYHHQDRDNGVALGVLGLAAGAIIGGAIADSRANQRVYVDPPRQVYYPPAPRYVQPAPRYVQPVYSGGLEPWSASWYDYCESRYRSFNPSTGTYRGYDGAEHFCAAN